MNDLETWKKAIPEGIPKEKFDRFKSVADLAKSYHEADVELSQRVRLPGDDASPEDRAKFYQKLGVPESVEGYALPTDLDDTQKELLAGLRESALEVGVTADGFSKLGTHLLEQLPKTPDMAAQSHEWEADLKAELGADFEVAKGEVKRAADQFLSDDDRDFLKVSGLAGHPSVFKLLRKVFSLMADDQIPGSPGGAPTKDGQIATLKSKYRDSQEKLMGMKASDPAYERESVRLRKIKSSLVDLGVSYIPPLSDEDIEI